MKFEKQAIRISKTLRNQAKHSNSQKKHAQNQATRNFFKRKFRKNKPKFNGKPANWQQCSE